MPPHVDLPAILASKPEKWRDWFVSIQCRCHGGRMLNLTTLCRERPALGSLALGEIVGKLRCTRCDEIPRTVELWSHQDTPGLHPEPAVKIRLAEAPNGRAWP